MTQEISDKNARKQNNALFKKALQEEPLNWEAARTARDNGIDPSAYSYLASAWVLEKIPYNTFTDLVRDIGPNHGADYYINTLNNLLHQATFVGRTDIADFLVAKGANGKAIINAFINKIQQTPGNGHICSPMLLGIQRLYAYLHQRECSVLKKELEEAKEEITTLRQTVATVLERLERVENPPMPGLDKPTLKP